MKAVAASLGCMLAATAAVAQGVPPYVPPEGTVTPGGPPQEYIPPVLTPTPSASDPAGQTAAIDRFRGAYQAHKSPRLAILWNRILSDDIDVRKYQVEREVRGSAGVGHATTTITGGRSTSYQPYGYGTLVEGSSGATIDTTVAGGRVSSREQIKGEEQVGSGARDPVMIERDMWRFEQGFSDPFVRAGAKLVDRNTIMRITADKSPQVGDKQRVEASALRGLADVFVEVLMTVDGSSPSGYVFRATAKDINTGQIIADVTSDGARSDAPGAMEYVATNHGFEARPSRNRGQANGATIAVTLMDQLSQAWR